MSLFNRLLDRLLDRLATEDEAPVQVTMAGTDYSPCSMEVLRLARAEAYGKPIKPEHLLLGLLKSDLSLVDDVLSQVSLSREDAIAWASQRG